MQRKKSQLLFNFLPDDTFNHAHNGTIGRISWIYKDRSSPVEDLPLNYMLRRIRPRVERWPNTVPLRPSSTEIVSPDGATFELFPRVFECRDCGACTQFSEGQIESNTNPYCGNCGKRFSDTEQLQFVTVCPGGTIGSISVPSCTSCGDGNPQFKRPTSRMGDAYWQCSNCGTRIGDAYYTLDRCDYCGKNKKIKVHSSSSTFYPQVEKFVNITDEDLEFITDSETYQLETIANYLVDEDAGSSQSEPEVPPDEVLERLDVTEEEYLAEMAEYEEEQAEVREKAEEWATDNLSDDERRIISEELFEYDSLVSDGDINDKTLDDLYDLADTRSEFVQSEIDQYRDARDGLYFDSVRLITDFPITTVVYGYSRLNPGPGEDSELNTFPGKGGDDRMFAQTADAEAVMFTLDEEQVLAWLKENDVIDDWPEMDNRRWLLSHLQDYPFYEDIDPSEDGSEEARYTLSLLHTLAHTAMNSIDALSGYSKSSLIEYLLPHTLSFVIYKHSDTDFNLGAMHTLIEDRFLEVADYIESDADVCMYDPVCEEEENASCEDCLYISNISCDNGNHNLSRSTIYGGHFDGREITGYLHTDPHDV